MNSEANIFQFFSIFMMAPNDLTANIFKLMFLKFENNHEKAKKTIKKKKNVGLNYTLNKTST